MKRTREDEEARLQSTQTPSVLAEAHPRPRDKPTTQVVNIPPARVEDAAAVPPPIAASAFEAPAPVAALPSDVHRALTAFDDRLVDALAAAVIRLVCSAWLLAQPDDFKMPYRQQLEQLERSGTSPSPLLSPEEAAALVRRGNRSVGAVTQ